MEQAPGYITRWSKKVSAGLPFGGSFRRLRALRASAGVSVLEAAATRILDSRREWRIEGTSG
jgi:hypothetical protein